MFLSIKSFAQKMSYLDKNISSFLCLRFLFCFSCFNKNSKIVEVVPDVTNIMFFLHKHDVTNIEIKVEPVRVLMSGKIVMHVVYRTKVNTTQTSMMKLYSIIHFFIFYFIIDEIINWN